MQPASDTRTYPPTTHIVNVPRIDRWLIHHRFQELRISSSCLEDGSLQVEVEDWISAVLVRSVIWHCLAPRQELLIWLERCWQA